MSERRFARGLGLVLAAALLFAAVPAASAAISLPDLLQPVKDNPVERLKALPIEDFAYDPATKCRKTPAPGAVALAGWLQRNVAGTNWGINRCELWGKGSASLHAEGRAVDWHLDAAIPAERKEAERLIALLLAPDSTGQTAALARRMGVQEIIYDCKSWFGGEPVLDDYSYCVGKDGRRKKGLNRTAAHIDHLHIGLNRAGAAKQTSFWTRRAPR